VHLAGQADPALAPVAERLHAAAGDPDRVGVVPVRLEPAAGEEDLGGLDPRRRRAEPDRIPPQAAGSFKTIAIGAS
jgi:hypothetical protein